jgi:hypothetical protein
MAPPSSPDAPFTADDARRSWEALCDRLRDAGRLLQAEDVRGSALQQAEGLRYLTEFLAAGINFCVAHADPEVPELTRMMDLEMRWGLDCPDCLYLVASLRGDAEYRLYGDPGTANHLDVQVNAGHYAEGRIDLLRTIGSLRGEDLVRGADGAVEVHLGGAPRPENWLPLAPDVEFLQIRQYFADWEAERPADLLIEQVGGSVSRPPIAGAEIQRRLERLGRWLSEGGGLWDRMSRLMLDMDPNSVFVFAPEDAARHSGLKGQAYCQGNFHCGSGEAVIFEFTPPPCKHWSISLANRFWQAIDFVTRQSSLNGHQARLDRDGVFRAVIADRDPGVPNWLDTAGHDAGTLIVRLLEPNGKLDPRARVVKLEEVRSCLPPETPRVEAAERAASLARRRRAAWRRYRR